MGKLKIVSAIFLLISILLGAMIIISPGFRLLWLSFGFMYVVLVYIIYLLWAIVDIVKAHKSGNWKLMWILIVLFVAFIGVLLYFLVGRGQKDEEEWEERLVKRIEAMKGRSFR